MKNQLQCPRCGQPVTTYRNPFPTVDIIIEMDGASTAGTNRPSDMGASSSAGAGEPREKKRIVLIKRKNPPLGWALPGGFVDYGESLETAAIREAHEETSLKVILLYQLGAYSEPSRDPRHHSISVVFVGRANGQPRAADDAAEIGLFHHRNLPEPMAFDHGKILSDYFKRCHSTG